MKEKKNLPQKRASRRLAEKLKEQGNRPPPQAIIDQLNREEFKDENKKVALPSRKPADLEM
jgi:cytidylate kinase